MELCGGGLGDLGCSKLAALENLKKLNLAQNERITNRGAACLAVLTKLKSLNLSYTSVSSDALRYFSNLKALQSIALFGCKAIKEKYRVGDLANTLPNLRCVRVSGHSREDGIVAAHRYDDMVVDELDYNNDSELFLSNKIMRERWAHNDSNDEGN